MAWLGVYKRESLNVTKYLKAHHHSFQETVKIQFCLEQ